jgi:hypothetical protein
MIFIYSFWKNFESNADKVVFSQMAKDLSDSQRTAFGKPM